MAQWEDFYDKHKSLIETIEAKILAQCPELKNLTCAQVISQIPDLEPLSDFINTKTPTAVKAYVAGVLMRSLTSTKRLQRKPVSPDEEILYETGVTLSRIGSYVILSGNLEASLKKADEVIVASMVENGASVSAIYYEDGKPIRETYRRPER